MEYVNHQVRKLTKSQLKLMTIQLDGSINKTRRELEEFCIQYLREVHEEPDTRHCIQISQQNKTSAAIIQADEQCPICFEQSHVLTNCGHSYCGECILSHIGQNGVNCPMCRTAIHSLETDELINRKRVKKLSKKSDEFYFKTVDKIQPVVETEKVEPTPPRQAFEFDYSYTIGGVTHYCVYTHLV